MDDKDKWKVLAGVLYIAAVCYMVSVLGVEV